jgi:hypothetical protein
VLLSKKCQPVQLAKLLKRKKLNVLEVTFSILKLKNNVCLFITFTVNKERKFNSLKKSGVFFRQKKNIFIFEKNSNIVYPNVFQSSANETLCIINKFIIRSKSKISNEKTTFLYYGNLHRDISKHYFPLLLTKVHTVTQKNILLRKV